MTALVGGGAENKSPGGGAAAAAPAAERVIVSPECTEFPCGQVAENARITLTQEGFIVTAGASRFRASAMPVAQAKNAAYGQHVVGRHMATRKHSPGA
jgi:hypothetical protein